MNFRKSLYFIICASLMGTLIPDRALSDSIPRQSSLTRDSICLIIESAARAEEIPLDFFVRIIWQESRFEPQAVGPVTRNGQQAQGIAQFMPETALELGLLGPFDPVQALPKSAKYLAILNKQFGNLGLAAAAYNAGPGRVQRWLSGAGLLPLETRSYVLAVTGKTVGHWITPATTDRSEPKPAEQLNCTELIDLAKRSRNQFVTRLEERLISGANKPWGVQLSAGFSRDHALKTYAKKLEDLTSLNIKVDPVLLGSTLRSRGSRMFYQVRIGAETRSQAYSLCKNIQQLNHPCMVLRN